jgi:hypothetical protein
MLSHAASMASIELICANPKVGQRELTHTLTEIPATVVFADSWLIPRLLTPLVECPRIRLIIYDSASEVNEDIHMLKNELSALKNGLQNRVKIVSIEELCRTGFEVLENFTLTKPNDKDRVWARLYARKLNEFEPPVAVSITNGQVAAASVNPFLQLLSLSLFLIFFNFFF